MAISFLCQIPYHRIKNKKLLKDWVLLVANSRSKAVEKIDFIFCDDDYLLQINKKFLAHQTLTDVITFDYSLKDSINAEIYISLERVIENAESYKISVADEMHRVMIHGVLHCIGLKDKKDQDRLKMRRAENAALRLLTQMSR